MMKRCIYAFYRMSYAQSMQVSESTKIVNGIYGFNVSQGAETLPHKIKKMNTRVIATKFVKWDIPKLESLRNSKVYALREKVNSGEKLERDEKRKIGLQKK